MFELILKEPKGLNKKGKMKWEKEVTIKDCYIGEKFVSGRYVFINEKVPELNYKHFEDHDSSMEYQNYIKHRWNFQAQFFIGMSLDETNSVLANKNFIMNMIASIQRLENLINEHIGDNSHLKYY